MYTFTDLFERVGPDLGSDWASGFTSGVGVYGHYVQTSANGQAILAHALGSGRHFVRIDCHQSYWPQMKQPVIVKMNAAGTSWYGFTYGDRGGAYAWYLYKSVGGVVTVLAYHDTNADIGTPYTASLEWQAGTLTGTAGGSITVSVGDSSLSGGTLAGFGLGSAQAYVDAFYAEGGVPQQFAVSPDYVGDADLLTVLALSGVNTTWTPGVPGVPTFTVSAGSLSGQVVLDVNAASAIFVPPAAPAVVTVTDPSTGLTDTITIIPGHYYGGAVGAGSLPSDVIAWLQSQANHPGLILTDADTTNGAVSGELLKVAFGNDLLASSIGRTATYPHVTTGDTVATLWSILNGSLPHSTGANVLGSLLPLVDDVADLRARWATGNDPTEYTADDILHILGGLPIKNHQDILDAISALPTGGSDSAVLSALSSLRGDSSASVAAALASLSALRTGSGYTLGSVKGWLDNLGASSSAPTALAVLALIAALALAVPTGGASVVAEAVAVGAGPLIDIATLVEVAEAVATLASIASDLASIKGNLSGAGALAAPVWPGATKATLGTLLPLSDGLVVPGPLHGLIVAMTGHPAGAGKYAFGSITSWQHCGAVVFASDAGHVERAESFGLDSQLITPRTMAEASSAVVRLNGGWSGTVRPWVTTA